MRVEVGEAESIDLVIEEKVAFPDPSISKSKPVILSDSRIGVVTCVVECFRCGIFDEDGYASPWAPWGCYGDDSGAGQSVVPDEDLELLWKSWKDILCVAEVCRWFEDSELGA